MTIDMNSRVLGFTFIIVTLVGVIVGQLCIKSGMLQIEDMPDRDYLGTLIAAFSNIRVLLGLFLAGIAACAWILTLSQLPLSYAYPFMSLTFPTVIYLSSRMFGESISPAGYLGMALIVVGLVIASIRT